MSRAHASQERQTGYDNEPRRVRRAVEPTRVYRMGEVAELVGVPLSAIRTERREGRLAFARVGNVRVVLGEVVLEWLRRLAACQAPAGAVESPRPVMENGSARRA